MAREYLLLHYTQLPMDDPIINYLGHERADTAKLHKRLERERWKAKAHAYENSKRISWKSIRSTRNIAKTLLRVSGLSARAARNALALEVTHIKHRVPNLPDALEGFKLLHLSDLHFPEDTALTRAQVEATQMLLTSLEAQCVVLTGDYRDRTFGPFDIALAGLADVLSALPQPKYAVLGNHDSALMIEPMESMSIQVLMNEHADITVESKRVRVAGVDDPYYYQTDDLPSAIDGKLPADVTVLLAHTPDLLHSAAQTSVNLYLCGHTHGGQICLPGGKPIVSNTSVSAQYRTGLWTIGDMSGYTHRGCGTSIINARFNCPPEIALHSLHRNND
ncbi:MAG: metallophosphoesterase [Gammaproteobacteria bacterium]|nr:metallophosphoesterase [Gammaproteobacteria bacterium]